MNFGIKGNHFQGFIFFLTLLFFIIWHTYTYSQSIPTHENRDKEITPLLKRNLFLEAELKLAKKGELYLVFDPFIRKIYLKNRGIVLREFQIKKIKYWREKGLLIEPIQLLKKKSFYSPERKEIIPTKPEEDANTPPKILFISVNEMPSSYTLVFEKNVNIFISPQIEVGFISRFLNKVYSILRNIYYSLIIIGDYFSEKNFAIVGILTDKESAQVLYWALPNNISMIIYGEELG